MINRMLVQECLSRGLGGLEFLASIPGSVGASCVQNAGFSLPDLGPSEISDYIESVRVLDVARIEEKILDRKDLSFSYRNS